MTEPRITEQDVQAIAVALRKRWGPCEHYECDDEAGMCHIPMVREVLAEATAQSFPLVAPDPDVVGLAWAVACAYADLPPEGLPGAGDKMLLSRTHLETVLWRVAPLLAERAAKSP
jgi:hypothetical protein